MKKTYKLLGYLLLGIGADAFLNANMEKTQAIAQEQSEPIQTNPTSSSRSRHTITLVLSQLMKN